MLNHLRLATTLLALAIACAIWPLTASAALGSAPSSESLFLAARDAAKAGDKQKLAKIIPQLAGYQLLPYVEAWNMRMRFAELPPDGISAWLANEHGSYVADRLRADWLKWLGQNQTWAKFETEYPKLINEDLEITCYAIAGRARLDPSAIDEARPLLLAAKDIPDSCAPLLEQLMVRGTIVGDQIWMKIRTAMQASGVAAAKRLFKFLPATEIPDAKAFDLVTKKPRSWLDKPPASLASRPARELTLFALQRLARADPQQAAAYWDRKLRSRFPAADQAYAWAALAYEAARHQDPDALKWFEETGGAPLTDEQLAWKVRAALRAMDWVAVNAAIAKMPEKMAREPAWTYWRGRAFKAMGAINEANAQFSQLIKEFHFYGQLAAEELGTLTVIPPKARAPTAEELAEVARLVAIRRAMLLYQLGMRFEGTREWQWAISGMEDAQLIAAAELARREQLYDRAINTADKTHAQHDFTLRYLMPYNEVLAEQSRALKLDSAWLYGLIRQESRFVFDAKSAAGAKGLMQLMPATAKWVAHRIGMGPGHLRDVTRADINIVLGTNYLRHVLDDLGHPVLASAAYNAGPGRARRWRGAQPLEGAIYAESIPFNETRDYVKKVMSNTAWYAALITHEPQSLKARLGTVGPRVSGEKFNEELP